MTLTEKGRNYELSSICSFLIATFLEYKEKLNVFEMS